MPQYFSPGVYIQEVPSALQAIQGVSTSITGLVGPADRGPTPGYLWPNTNTNLPFTPFGGFLLTPDPAPVSVTSFAQFQRVFGPPLPIPNPSDPTDYGFLGWAAKGFFDNGGQIAYVARIVNPSATPSTVAMLQGVAYRLARSALPTDSTVYLTSIRGLNIGDAVTFQNHVDDSDVFGHPAEPPTATGGIPPFALHDGDSFTATASDGNPAPATPVFDGKAAFMTTTAATFPNLNGTTLLLTVDGGSAQTIPFNGDAITPLSATPTSLEVAAFLARFAQGVTVSTPALNTITVTTNTAGTSASLVVAGTAAPILGFAITASAGNVADLSAVTLAEVQGLLAGFTVGGGSGQPLTIASTDPGSAVKLTLADAVTAPGTLSRLGFGPVSNLDVFGLDAVVSTLTVQSYNTQQNSITFSAPLGALLDATKVYLIGANDQPSGALGGPTFIARSPGSWSVDLSISIANADRQPTSVTAPAVVGATVIQVLNVSSFYVGGTLEIDHNGAGKSVHQVIAINTGLKQVTIDPPLAGPALTVPGASVRTLEINIVVSDLSGASPTETYNNVAWAQGNTASLQRHYAWIINAQSSLVWVQPPPAANETFDIEFQPTTSDGFPVQPTGANVGIDGLPQSDDDWIGQDNGPGMRTGIQALLDAPPVSLIAAPGKTSQAIQQALIDQCELNQLYRFAIIDGERDPDQGSITSILAHRSNYDTSYAAYYQPWITIYANGQNWQLPPSCFMPGIMARVDNTRGVWKAPANEPVLDSIGLKTYFGRAEQDQLNPVGVNLVRRFDLLGITVWGARTLSSDVDLMYINVRRTLNYIEQSIEQGTQWVVFEPNTPDTWARVTASVSAFLLTLWRNGGLFGRSSSDAFFVVCDETTMTSDDILNGRLICQVGVAIVRPAEFVIFQIQQITNFNGAGATT